MKKWTQMDFAAWLSLISIACMFSGGCASSQSKRISSLQTNYTTGSFLEQDDCIAKLDIKGVHNIPMESTKVWKTTFRDNRGVSYNVALFVYAKADWGLGRTTRPAPVWTLTVNGQSVVKETAAWWTWTAWGGQGKLTVNGVEFAITNSSGVVSEANLKIKDVSLW